MVLQRLGLERAEGLRSGDDLNCPPTQVGESIEQFLPAVDTISEHVPQLGEASPDHPQQRHRCVIGAHSVVVNPIPSYTVAVGAPARPIEYFGPEDERPPELADLPKRGRGADAGLEA